MKLSFFHPAVAAWFEQTFAGPTECQLQAWPIIKGRRHTLIAAPTGSGKTLAAFLAVIDELISAGIKNGALPEQTQVVYVSPLKALSNDIHKNLAQPLQGIRQRLCKHGFSDLELRTAVRTGDTPQTERVIMRRRPPHILVTTPESLYIVLTSDSGRAMLRNTRTIIVDEIHAIFASKRGSHLALSLERLQALTQTELVRIGLSATQNPIEEIAHFLLGAEPPGKKPDCTIINTGHVRARDLAIELPDSPLEAVMSNEVWEEIYERLSSLAAAHGTTLVFVNTRRMAERVARHLSERLGEQNVTSHHGSLAREQRLAAEQRLKAGELRALVATASLELGIDIGDVDLVCQLGSTRSIATFLQRAGRAGHAVDGIPKARLFPLSRDELVECAALLDAIRRGELDRLRVPSQPLDVLAQQIVAMVACEEWGEDDLFACVRRAWPYRGLKRTDFDAVVRMLTEGYSSRRGQRGAYLHRDAVHARLRPRRGARLTAVTCGGAIPDNADYEVRQEPHNNFVGTLDEDFAVESLAGDIFQLGNTSWRILRVEADAVRVEDAQGQPPNIPFWFGEAPARSDALSYAVSRLRTALEDRIARGHEPQHWLISTVGITTMAADQIVDYLSAGRNALGAMPTQDTVVAERFFDESGGMQLVIHAPFGSRINRAWGLALRKRFCRKFNIELQAAATEDAIVISLGETHSFPLLDLWRYLNSSTVRDLLVQALLDAPMFTTRWRWTATCSLAVPRFRGGKKVAPRLQRMNAEDLLAVIFPGQIACLENVTGAREVPDHPLVRQTIHDCLTEAMDVDGLVRLLEDMQAGRKRLLVRDLTEPSPLAQEVLTANPYAFLDDAPLEERRTQAVLHRRWLGPESAAELGRLDPAAIERVIAEAWPEAQTPDELHDALMTLGFLTEAEIQSGPPGLSGHPWPSSGSWPGLLQRLVTDRRATCLTTQDGYPKLWIPIEGLPQLLALLPDAKADPALSVPGEYASREWSEDEALLEVLRSRLQGLGPMSAESLARPLCRNGAEIQAILNKLESEGFVLRGSFTPRDPQEWCERRLLARIHRYSLNRLRREIEPVSSADFMRFLIGWQHAVPGGRLEGAKALFAVIQQLEGFAAPAACWEEEILPLRIADYQAEWIDALCLSGRVAWVRRVAERNGHDHSPGPLRTTPVSLIHRRHLPIWLQLLGDNEMRLSPLAQRLMNYLSQHGASFFEDFAEAVGALRSQVEDALSELVAAGQVSSDSFRGLRALLIPTARRRGVARNLIEHAGRWSMTFANAASAQHSGPADPQTSAFLDDGCRHVETIAWTLLRRYGVVFRRVVQRETALPPWRDLLYAYRRLEARGEIRGGRFVAGMSGEQYAVPEAVAALRALRRAEKSGELVSICAADPLNLVGILTPGPRVPALVSNRILYRDGVAIAARLGRQVRIFGPLEGNNEWELQVALVRKVAPIRMLGRRSKAESSS